nr:copia protein [Tanacetum cinerariifolium]
MAVRDFKKLFRRRGRFVRQPRNNKKTFQRSRDDKNGKSERKCFRCGDSNHLIGECPKPPKDKNQRAFVEGTEWVFSNKFDENGIVSRNKARLVAQGYNQQEGIGYDETYAPVARLESIRILLAYACALDVNLFQMDVKSAFLNGFINEEVYMAQPSRFINFKKPDHVYKLKKGTEWVFSNKFDENGIVSRNKARLVTQGYNQQEGIGYDETYAPVARLESIRILLAYACALDVNLFQMDVKSAFLNGFINEEVYMAQPSRFINFKKPNHVYKLKKGLYVLKQEPKSWYDRLKAFLIKHE